MQAYADACRANGRTLALVPTMGGLHAGHLALVREAGLHGDHVTVSIFVNPTQFSPEEDLAAYPRDLEEDLRTLEEAGGVDAVFAPDVETLYPGGPDNQRVWLDVGDLAAHLCGRFRPGHFRGVVTVVAKLFLSCKPHVAVFGRKDAQQYVILRHLAKAFPFDVRVIGVDTVRTPDGLALSSRNAYLDPVERAQAVVLSRAVARAREMVEEGEQCPGRVVAAMLREISVAPLATVQYAEVVSTETLQPVTHIDHGCEILAAVAVFIGAARLIDNVIVRAPHA